MNLVPAIGFRTVYTYEEVSRFAGLTKRRLQNLVVSGRLLRRGVGGFPFMQKDVNQFLVRLNAGEIALGAKVREVSRDARALDQGSRSGESYAGRDSSHAGATPGTNAASSHLEHPARVV